MKVAKTELTVLADDDSISGDTATQVTVVDEGGGAFVEVSQPGRYTKSVQINTEELPVVRSAIDEMVLRAGINHGN